MASSVETFMQVAEQLINEVATYVGKGQHDETTESNIRQVRVMNQALSAALLTGAGQPIVPKPTQ